MVLSVTPVPLTSHKKSEVLTKISNGGFPYLILARQGWSLHFTALCTADMWPQLDDHHHQAGQSGLNADCLPRYVSILEKIKWSVNDLKNMYVEFTIKQTRKDNKQLWNKKVI